MAASDYSDASTFAFTRRSFVYGSAATVFTSTPAARAALLAGETQGPSVSPSMNLFVSPDGDDRDGGTQERPLRTFKAAQTAVRALRRNSRGAITVYFRRGTYYLDQTLVLGPEHSGEQQAQVL